MERNKKIFRKKYKNMNSIIIQNKLNINNWYYIDKTII